MQHVFIYILNPIYSLFTSRIKSTTRMMIVNLALFFTLGFFYMCYCSPKLFNLSLDYSAKGFISIVPLFIAIIFSINGPLKKIQWNKWLYLCWGLFGVVLMFWEIVLDMGYGFIPFIFSVLVLFPCLYFVWSNRGDYEVLFVSLASTVVVLFVLFYIICVFLFPMGVENMLGIGRYNGAVKNPNTIGTITATAVIASLYLIIHKRSRTIIYMIVCAIAISLCFYAASRASMLAIIIQLMIFAFYVLNERLNKEEKKAFVKKIVLLALIVMVVIPVNKPILEYDPLNRIASAHFAYAEDTIESSAVNSTENNTSIIDRITIKGKDLNTISSGRISVWSVYLDNISFKGHDVNEKSLIAEANGLWAHNVFIELAYRGGLLAGVLYFIIVAYTVVYAFKILILRRNYPPYMMFTILSTATFFIISMLEMTIFPLERDYILLYFIGLTPLFGREASRC